MSSSSLWVDPESWLATPMLFLEMIWLEHGFTPNSFISPIVGVQTPGGGCE